MVLTCFDELIDTRGIALLRGDLISNLNEDEGQTIMRSLLDRYLVESQYETVRKFNHQSAEFDYEEYINEALVDFNRLKQHHIDTKQAKVDLGPPKKRRRLTDQEMNIKKGGIIR